MTEVQHSTGNHNALGAVAMLGAAVAWAIVPALVHWTLDENNAFIFGAIQQAIGSVLILTLLLLYKGTKPSWPPISVIIQTIKIVKLPMIVVVLGGFNVALFSYSTKFVETAVASALYETWPIFVVYGLVAFDRSTPADPTAIKHKLPPVLIREIVLCSIATAGLVFMLVSQAENGHLLKGTAILGMAIALLSGVLASFDTVGSIASARSLSYRLAPLYSIPQSVDKQHNPQFLTWLTVFVAIISRAVSIPLQLALGVVADGSAGFINSRGLLGAILIGVTGAISFAMLRLGNVLADRAGVNAIFLLSPAIALSILAVSGIDLPRFDLFLIGAMLIGAINMLIQLQFEQEREPGVGPRSGSRLGFTVMILALWFCGTTLYIRDELLPKDWLVWPSGDHWTILALSATVFSLILGFRVTRLGGRIEREDNSMLLLLRDAEHLHRHGIVSADFLDQLAVLDSAHKRDLIVAYRALRGEIQPVLSSKIHEVHYGVVRDVEARLDALCHSKQQGRDIVELFALSCFAFVTVGLGLLSRQAPVAVDDLSRWSGFLSEVFVLLFASTIIFLFFNLFDLRRDRDAPLFEASVETRGDSVSHYHIFFRHEQSSPVHLYGSIVIAIAIASSFVVLLHDKWLP